MLETEKNTLKDETFPCIKTVRGVIEGFVFNLKPVV